MLKSLNKVCEVQNNHSKLKKISVNCSYTQRFEQKRVSQSSFSMSTVMSGKFGLASGKSQGNVREFCFVKSV